MAHRRYFDNAATSFPKPDSVLRAMVEYQGALGAAYGRGAYRSGVAVQALVDRARRRAADLLRAESPDRIVFAFNGTDALNLAIHGLVPLGGDACRIVTTQVEHNSVMRPLRELERQHRARVDVVRADGTGRVDPDEFRRVLRMGPAPRLVAVTHASNVTGAMQPIDEIIHATREAGSLVLLDAAQTAGHLPIDLQQLRVDLLACPGHKGLLGPLGTALLYVRPGVEAELASLRQGGTGTDSASALQPARMPEKYEAGNHNVPGLAGLGAALEELLRGGVDFRAAHRQADRLREGLARLPGVTVHGPQAPAARCSIVSFTHAEWDPATLAAILDEQFGVECRAGLHCAPGAHAALGTLDRGGTLRLSPGPFTTDDDTAWVLRAVAEIVGA